MTPENDNSGSAAPKPAPLTDSNTFLRGKASALARLHRQAEKDPNTALPAHAESRIVFDQFIKGTARDNIIAFPTAKEAAEYLAALDYLRSKREIEYFAVVVSVECTTPAD